MRKWLALLSGLILFCGCTRDVRVGRLSIGPPDFSETLADMAGMGIKAAAGDNAGPLFTGETRGEYHDRKEVEQMGSAGFERRYHRAPDLYLSPGSTDW